MELEGSDISVKDKRHSRKEDSVHVKEHIRV